MRISDWSSDVCSSDLESGSNWLWESDESGCLAYVSPQFGELLGQDHQSLVGKKLVDLFRPHMGAGDHKSGLPILEFNLADHLVFRAVILPGRVDGTKRWLSRSGGRLLDGRNQFVSYRW